MEAEFALRLLPKMLMAAKSLHEFNESNKFNNTKHNTVTLLGSYFYTLLLIKLLSFQAKKVKFIFRLIFE